MFDGTSGRARDINSVTIAAILAGWARVGNYVMPSLPRWISSFSGLGFMTHSCASVADLLK